jgi:hypothetical protein
MKPTAHPIALGGIFALFLVASTAHAAGKMRVLLLPTDFTVLELSASGIAETVPDWTKAAEASLDEAARGVLTKSANFELVTLPELTADEQAALKEYVALYKLTAFTASQVLNLGGAWRDKRTHFDYTLGGGLDFLAKKSGADAALCIAGAQVKSSGGRVAMFILLAAAGVAIPLGGAQITAGLIDLTSGDVTWMDFAAGVKGDVRAADGASGTLDELIGKYPKSRLLGRN